MHLEGLTIVSWLGITAATLVVVPRPTEKRDNREASPHGAWPARTTTSKTAGAVALGAATRERDGPAPTKGTVGTRYA